MDGLKRTPLYDLHVELGAKLVPFAGWEMPVNYPMGVLKEHLHTREKAGLFDVSHMGQILLLGGGADAALETLVPVDLLALKPFRQRYALFTAPDGGILDDLMVTRQEGRLYLVVNASRADHDRAHLKKHLSGVKPISDRALLALQGPAAEAALEALIPGVAAMKFMDHAIFGEVWVSRSGYTGEDGFEISLPATAAEGFARKLLENPDVAPIGLGARDSLRLESGLCLYGNDIDTTTSPVAAGLTWAIQKTRREGARAGGFPGEEVILRQLSEGAAHRRVGLLPEGRAPMREGVALFARPEGDNFLGRITSGGFAPSLGKPIAMGYVPRAFAAEGTVIWGEQRGKRSPLTVAAMPFRPVTYKR